MRELIKSVLEKYKDSQLNLGSSAVIEMLSEEIENVLISIGEKNEKVN